MRSSAFTDAEVASLQRATQENAKRLEAKPYLRAKSMFVTLTNGTVTVAHGLKRRPAGWMLHSVIGTAHAFVPVAPDAANIQITAIAVGSCTLEVW